MKRTSSTWLDRGVRYVVLGIPVAFILFFLAMPLVLMVVVSFWRKTGFWVTPALTLRAYQQFFASVQIFVLRRSLVMAIWSTLASLAIAYPVAYFLARHVKEETARLLLLLITVPFVINYVIRTFSWTYLLGREGPINSLLVALGIVHRPIDWLLFSDFSVWVGMVASYMPFMIYPLWLALAGVDRLLVEASWILGAGPGATFLRVTLPLSLPGIFAAIIFGFVGSFGESAVPTILGGVGYQMMGNTITSVLGVLNYPLAAALSSIVLAIMIAFLLVWYAAFDVRAFLGKIVQWRV
jgi:ABC-type spermidine/putrescine transport system permease subunit I